MRGLGPTRCAVAVVGTACVSVSAQVIFDNGPLLTAPNTCASPPAGMASERQLNNTEIGFGMQSQEGDRLTDDFQVSSPGGWTITALVLYGYQPGTVSNQPTITGVSVRIWDRCPAEPGALVVFGDPTTNRLSTAMFSSVYRVTPIGVGCSTARPVFALRCTISGLTLPPGTYWVDWQGTGNAALSGPWSPPVTITGLAGKPGANARQFQPDSSAWVPVVDQGSGAAQDLAFQVLGVGLPGMCYANCDNSTVAPALNIADFSCFINRFFAGQSYANCDLSTMPPVLNIADFACFLNRFGSGCS